MIGVFNRLASVASGSNWLLEHVSALISYYKNQRFRIRINSEALILSHVQMFESENNDEFDKNV